MFGSQFGMGPLQANSFSGGIGDIQDALLQANNQQALPGMQPNYNQPMAEEEEEDEIQKLQRMFGGGDGMVQKTLRGDSIAGKIGHMAMGNPMGGMGGGGLAGMLGGLFG